MLWAVLPKWHKVAVCHSSGSRAESLSQDSAVPDELLGQFRLCTAPYQNYLQDYSLLPFKRWILKCPWFQALSWNAFALYKISDIFLLCIFGVIFRLIFLLHQNFDISCSALLVWWGFYCFSVLELTLPNLPEDRNQRNFPLHTATHEIITCFTFCPSVLPLVLISQPLTDQWVEAPVPVNPPIILHFAKI